MPPRSALPPKPRYSDLPVWPHNFDNVETRTVNSAWNWLFETNFEELSFRTLAKELGVTPPALYHYFPTLTALGAALACRACATLFAQVTVNDAVGIAAARPLEEFVENYLDFAEKRRRHYGLLLSPQFSNDEVYPAVLQHRLNLLGAVKNLLVAQVGREVEVEELQVFAALIHGSASLVASGHNPHTRELLKACKLQVSALRKR